jgi:putative toxin-antitoxin system antitoxin component (TIGR02293 family)
MLRANGQVQILNKPVTSLDIVGANQPNVDVVALVRQGLPVQAVQHVLDTGRLTAVELDHVVLPRRTLANRRKLGTLTPEQSDRLVRAAAVLAAAEDVFGSQQKAGTWLRRATAALGNQAPMQLLDTDAGTRQVESLLGRISHGIAA